MATVPTTAQSIRIDKRLIAGLAVLAGAVGLAAVLISGGVFAAGSEGKHAEAGPVHHVVLLAFKDSATKEEIDSIEAGIEALGERIEEIESLAWGTGLNEGAKTQGFTHCLLMTFPSREALARYGPHPAQEEFKQLAGPHIDKILVFDFVDGD